MIASWDLLIRDCKVPLLDMAAAEGHSIGISGNKIAVIGSEAQIQQSFQPRTILHGIYHPLMKQKKGKSWLLMGLPGKLIQIWGVYF
jgi:hypothetical protein